MCCVLHYEKIISFHLKCTFNNIMSTGPIFSKHEFYLPKLLGLEVLEPLTVKKVPLVKFKKSTC